MIKVPVKLCYFLYSCCCIVMIDVEESRWQLQSCGFKMIPEKCCCEEEGENCRSCQNSEQAC